MKKEIISSKQGVCILVLFVIGSSIVLGTSREARQDVWIAIPLGLIMSIPMLFVYSKLLLMFAGKNLFEIFHEVFGQVIGKFISLIFVWYSFHLGALVIRNFSEFVQIVSLPETPQFIIVIFLALLSIWAVKSGIEVLGRWSTFILPIVLFFILGTLILSFQKMNFINIKPVLFNGIQPVLQGAFSTFAFPFAESVVFTVVLNKLKQANQTFKVFFIGVLIGGIIILVTAVRNILVLGVNSAADFYFPSYLAVRTINIGEFIQRIEILLAVNYIFAGFVKASICLYVATTGVAKILNIEKSNQIAAPIGFLMTNFAFIVYSSTMEMFDWGSKIYTYYAAPFQVILPIVILISAFVKARYSRKS